MGLPPVSLRAILLLQGLTIGLLAWESVENHLLKEQLRLAVRELGAIREDEIQLARVGSPGAEPPSGGTVGVPPSFPEVGHQHLGWFNIGTTAGLVRSFAILLVFLVGLLLAGKLWLSAGSSVVEPVTPSSPEGKQQLARRQLAELRLRQHGFGGQTGAR